MTQYLRVDTTTHQVTQTRGDPDPADFVGQLTAPPEPEDGVEFKLWQTEKFRLRGGPTSVSIPYWLPADADPTWRDDRVLADELARALAKPYADIDAVVKAAVGERTKEYERREAAARAYVASGYVDPVPDRVAVWAQYNPTMQTQTARWSADNILARADALVAKQDAMGDQRFISQYAMRAATTLAELDAAVAAWGTFIAQIRAQLGL